MPTVSFRNEDKKSVSIAERVNTDKVKEWWVQQYVAAHYARLGFEEVKGPFDSGPDFRVLHKGKWVIAEVEVACENYLTHKHHGNPKWRSCAVLIVLSEKKPAKETKKYLPKTILYLDKAHFEEWYRTAAREFALTREKEKAEGKVFGISYSDDDDDGFEWQFSSPVYYSLYCEKCDKTLIVQTSRQEGFSDYESVYCPHCKTNLGEIRADMGFQIVGEKKGNYGNSLWQVPTAKDTGEE